MSNALDIPAKGDLDFLSLGALVHRLDPGIYPFHKASSLQIHVSGGEFNRLPICQIVLVCGRVSRARWSTIRSAI